MEQFDRLMRLTEVLAGVGDIGLHLREVRTVLDDLVGADQLVWTSMGPTGTPDLTLTGDALRPDAAMLDAVRRCMVDHPLALHFRGTDDRRPRRISDVTTAARWRATAAYVVARTQDATHALRLPLPAAPGSPATSWTLLRRDHDFTDAERDRVEAVAPTLVALWRARVTAPAAAHPPAVEPAADAPALTPRRREVLALLARGLSARQLAAVLRISERTVHKHLQHIYDALGVNDRVTAVRRARASGLLPAATAPTGRTVADAPHA